MWMGANEATAIAVAQQGMVPQRPLTHDLMRDMLEALEIRLTTVNITALRDGIFFADLIFSNGREVSARPSDSIALALRTGASIFVSEEILDEAGVAIPDEQEDEVEKFREFLDTITPEDLGFRGPVACSAAGITYRQLDYWARTGLVEPSVRPAAGSGSQRLYGFRDILVLKVVKRLLDTGISLQQIRAAVTHLRERGSVDLAQVTLMSDGVSVYEGTSPDEVVDLLQGRHGLFGIALGRVWREVEGTLAELPSERAEDDPAGDELASRRARKTG